MPFVVRLCGLFMFVTAQPNADVEASMRFHIVAFVRTVAVDAVMVIATGNGVVKEDIASKLDVHAVYLPWT